VTLTELTEQWNKRAGNCDDLSFGLRTAAEELDDFIREHYGEAVE
jgi:hypothetical protein